MAKIRREESEWRFKRQGKGICKEGGDEFKASTTRGRIKEEVFLRENVWDESKTDIGENSKRPKQPD
jgi:hypothetical protein